MGVFINGMGNISPQKSWEDETLLAQAFDYKGKLTCIEPDYSKWIDLRQLRRMSRVIKMGVAAASMALKEASVEKPDGIITGTGYGCLDDTGIFLSKMIENLEQALNPTPFIQSTHNTIGAQIALLLQCQEYNQTFAHGPFSFESSLLDAMLQLGEEPSHSMLVGGVDEITNISDKIQSRFGIFRTGLMNSLDLFKIPGRGTLNGEGAAYFVLSGVKGTQSKVSIESLITFYKPYAEELKKGIATFLYNANLKAHQIDLVLLGKSGDQVRDHSLDEISSSLFPSSSIGLFKHLCGEYPTASAFALWLGARILQEHHIPDVVVYKDAGRTMRNVLIYNQYFGTHHSLILLRSCRDII